MQSEWNWQWPQKTRIGIEIGMLAVLERATAMEAVVVVAAAAAVVAAVAVAIVIAAALPQLSPARAVPPPTKLELQRTSNSFHPFPCSKSAMANHLRQCRPL